MIYYFTKRDDGTITSYSKKKFKNGVEINLTKAQEKMLLENNPPFFRNKKISFELNKQSLDKEKLLKIEDIKKDITDSGATEDIKKLLNTILDLKL